MRASSAGHVVAITGDGPAAAVPLMTFYNSWQRMRIRASVDWVCVVLCVWVVQGVGFGTKLRLLAVDQTPVRPMTRRPTAAASTAKAGQHHVALAQQRAARFSAPGFGAAPVAPKSDEHSESADGTLVPCPAIPNAL
jgi:hypothetical protein